MQEKIPMNETSEINNNKCIALYKQMLVIHFC
jgi:hypothetical protein